MFLVIFKQVYRGESMINKLLGGRPMKLEPSNFIDIVSGLYVNTYVDKFGRRWMANNRWGLIRVLIKNSLHGEVIEDKK